MQRRSSPEASRPSQISRLLRSSEAVNAAGVCRAAAGQPGVARVAIAHAGARVASCGGSGSSSTAAPRTPISRTEAANAGGGGQRGVVAVDSARARQRPSSGGGRRFGCRPGWTVNQIPSAPGSLESVGSHSCGPDRSQGYHTLSFRLPLVLTRAGRGRRKSSGARVAAAGLVVSPRHLDGRMPLHGAAHPPIDIAGHSAHRRCMATAA